MDLFNLANDLYVYLKDKGINFTVEGYPIITEDMILKEMPDEVCRIGKTNLVKSKNRALLVSFGNDEEVYKWLFSLNKMVDYAGEYLAFGGFDLSPRINWDMNLQKFNILLNRLADAFLAVNGIKLMPNFRTGCLDTIGVLDSYPKHAWYAVGALGCARGNIKINQMYLGTKILIANPDMLIYYGKLRNEYVEILDGFGIPYKVFPDYQRMSRGKEVA